ncbi:MAG: tetratricopeptide repeat protein [Fibromonadaceae bacterium]|nr:tetratricopeptide repeat protein [Fibromonadaceae bacterium]
MAKKSTSKLAPEDKRFVVRVGLFLFFLLLLSGGALYFYTKLKNENRLPEFLNKYTENFPSIFGEPTSKDSLADTTASDFELPPPPIPMDMEDIAEANSNSHPTKSATQVSINEITRLLLEKPLLAARFGHLLLDAGYFNEAVYILQNGIPLDSAPVPVLVDLAYGHLYSKNFEAALNELEDALNKYPGNADLLTAKAAMSGQHPDTSQRSEADAMFKAILKKNPESAEANYQYGRYIMQRGNFKNSQGYLEKAVKIEPYNSRYIARLGMAEYYLRQNANAETLYKRALKLNPGDYNTWFNLGELYLNLANEGGNSAEVRKKIHLALESYIETIKLDSLHANANYRIGLILNGNGGHGESIKHLNIALEQMPSSIPVMQQLSSAYLHLQDTVKSVDYLEKILQIDPFNRIAASEFRRIKNEKQ